MKRRIRNSSVPADRTTLRPRRPGALRNLLGAGLSVEQHAFELGLAAGLQDGQHLIARLEFGRADSDLGLTLAHDRDEARGFRKSKLLDSLAGGGRSFLDLQLDELQVLLE